MMRYSIIGCSAFLSGIAPLSANLALIEGTSELLYAVVREDTVYFICLDDHGSFASEELLRIVHENWPELIEPFIITDIEPDDICGPFLIHSKQTLLGE